MVKIFLQWRFLRAFQMSVTKIFTGVSVGYGKNFAFNNHAAPPIQKGGIHDWIRQPVHTGCLP